MTPHRHWVRNYSPLRTPIRLADNSIIYSSGVGTVVFNPVIGGKASQPVEFTRVLHVPCFRTIFSLASISPNIRELRSTLTHTKWTLSVLVGHFSVLQLALQTVPTSLVPLNHLQSWPTGSPPCLSLHRSGIVAAAITTW
jgi:hypothetical protein